MGKYFYVGVTRQKERVNGVVDAPDEIEAKLRLRSMQIRPLSISLEKPSKLRSFNLNEITIGGAVTLKGMIVFTRQFSSLIDAGIPIVQCLGILHEQEKSPIFKKALGKIKEDIEGGAGLAESLSKYPQIFSEFFIRVTEAGEMSGTLDTAIRRIGVQLEKLGRLKAKVVGAMVYPGITMFVAVIVLIFLLVKVIPEVAKLYGESNAKLPDITIMVLGLSQTVQNNFITIIGTMVGFVVTVMMLAKWPKFRKYWDPVAIRLPLFGPLIQKSSIARFARTMSTLISSGVPMLTAFEICAKLMSNYAIRENIQRASAAVSEGKSMASGLAVKGIFPAMVIHMVNIGEMTGKLDDLLGKVGDIYDEEVDDAISNLTGLLNPIMVVIVGVMIAFLLIAMYLPIFQLADKVAG